MLRLPFFIETHKQCNKKKIEGFVCVCVCVCVCVRVFEILIFGSLALEPREIFEKNEVVVKNPEIRKIVGG
jgi:hypothetical protein